MQQSGEQRRLNGEGLFVLVLVGVLTWGAGEPGMAQGVAIGEAVEPVVGFGEINWTRGWIMAKGLGVPPSHATPNQARALAERAGYVVALRNLLEIVNGVRVDAESVADSYLTRNEVIRTRVSGLVRGAQIVQSDVQADGSVEVTVKMPLWGADSLVTAFLGEKAVRSHTLPPESPNKEGYTGLVIDARGLEVNPACFPAILDDQGRVLYGPEIVDRATAEKHGLVEYHTLPRGANLSSPFGDQAYVIRPVQIAPALREGRRPLKIKGVNRAGELKANIMISAEDAKKIRGDAHIGSALRRSKVVIVTDPLIGGIEGRIPAPDGLLAALRAGVTP